MRFRSSTPTETGRYDIKPTLYLHPLRQLEAFSFPRKIGICFAVSFQKQKKRSSCKNGKSLYYLWGNKSTCKAAIKKGILLHLSKKTPMVFICSEFVFFSLAFVEFMHFFAYIKVFLRFFPPFSYYSFHNTIQFNPKINKIAWTYALLMSSVKMKIKTVILINYSAFNVAWFNKVNNLLGSRLATGSDRKHCTE